MDQDSPLKLTREPRGGPKKECLRRFSYERENGVYEVVFRDEQPYEIVATLLTLMVLPREPPTSEITHRFRIAISTALLKGIAECGGGHAQNYWCIRPEHFSASEKDARAAFRKVTGNLNKRLAAGAVALGRLQILHDFPDGGLHVPMSQLMRLVLKDQTPIDMGNAVQRLWRDVLPVMPICAGFAGQMQVMDSTWTSPFSVLDLVLSRQAVAQLVGRILALQDAMQLRPEFFQPAISPRIIIKCEPA